MSHQDMDCTEESYLDGLVHIANILRFHVCVLFPTAHQFWESSKKALYSDPAHVHKLPGHQGCKFHQVCQLRLLASQPCNTNFATSSCIKVHFETYPSLIW